MKNKIELIDKSAVVAEIERLSAYLDSLHEQKIIEKILSIIDTLEVKEMDLDRAIDKWIDDAAITHEDCSVTDVISTAKHFFELGLKAKGE
jgi:hypothetical protein